MKKALAGGMLGLDLVAWGGIEPPTRGFSKRFYTIQDVLAQALVAQQKWGVRFSVVFLNTLLAK